MVQQQPHLEVFPLGQPRVSVCVRVCLCAIQNTIWTIPTYISSEFEKHPRSAQTSQQQRTSYRLICSCTHDMYEQERLLPPFQLATLAGTQVNREPCTTYFVPGTRVPGILYPTSTIIAREHMKYQVGCGAAVNDGTFAVTLALLLCAQ